MKLRNILIFPMVLALLFATGCRKESVAELPAFADRLYESLSVNDASPSVSILVVSEGKTVFEKSYGCSDIRTGEKANAHTNYRLACLSKPFTAMAALILSEQGKLELDEPVSSYLPEFPDYAREVTVRQLMNGDSGLPSYYPMWPVDGETLTDAAILKLLTHEGTMRFRPGIKVEIENDTAFVILSQVVERVSGIPYPDFLKQYIFEPAGMDNTVALVEGYNTVPHRAYGSRSIGQSYEIADQYAYSATLGDGGIYSSLHDLALWNRALNENLLVSQKTLSDAYRYGTLRKSSDHPEMGFAAGWGMLELQGVGIEQTAGSSIGFKNNFIRIPERNSFVLILSNIDGNYDVIKHSEHMCRMLLAK